MSNITNKTLSNKLDDFCKENDYRVEKVKNFADIFLVQDTPPDIFFCEIASTDYIKLYNNLKEDNSFFVPKTIFIYDGKEAVNYKNCYNSSKLIDGYEFAKLLSFKSMIILEDREENILNSCLKNLGLSYLCIGTKYLEVAIKLIYLNQKQYKNNYEACFGLIGYIYGKTTNAIKKSILYAIEYSLVKKCKDMKQLIIRYGKASITIKFIINYILTYFLCCDVS